VQFWAPDDGRKSRLKHVDHLTGINKLRNVASYWLYSDNTLAMHGHVNVKKCNPTLSLTSALDGYGWSTPRPGSFTPGKETPYLFYRRLGGPQGRYGRVRKISPPWGLDPRTVQLVAIRYTDWVIPAYFMYCRKSIFKYTLQGIHEKYLNLLFFHLSYSLSRWRLAAMYIIQFKKRYKFLEKDSASIF